MDDEKIDKLIGSLKEHPGDVRLKNTHISWLILTDEFVYKIKKPLKLSFLDYSTIEKRRHFCQKEIELNRRLTRDLYLDVEAISEKDDDVYFGAEKIIDYAVKMKRIDEKLQMDELIRNGRVSLGDIRNIAATIANKKIWYGRNVAKPVQRHFIHSSQNQKPIGLRLGRPDRSDYRIIRSFFSQPVTVPGKAHPAGLLPRLPRRFAFRKYFSHPATGNF